MGNATIFILEDDPDILEVLSLYVENAGYRVLKATNLDDAWKLIQRESVDVLLLDVNLPDGTGYEFAKKVRAISNAVMIFITVNNSIDDKLEGFEVGADDYITKPFIPKEVLVRIQAHLKRASQQNQSSKLQIGNLTIYTDEKNVYKNGELINLFTKEKKLLFYLIEHANKVIHAEQLINYAWGYDEIVDIKTVSVHISTLRKKIEDDPANPQMLITVRGFGYKFIM